MCLKYPSKHQIWEKDNGNKLVTPMGNASVTHHNAITTAIAAVIVTPGLPGTKSRKNTIPKNEYS
jgi:hypothetical protein